MKKYLWMIICLCALASCMVKPPVQEMAEARSAVKAVQMAGGSTSESAAYLKSAESALKQASEAIEKQMYVQARSKALEAKRQAKKAARISQKDH